MEYPTESNTQKSKEYQELWQMMKIIKKQKRQIHKNAHNNSSSYKVLFKNYFLITSQ